MTLLLLGFILHKAVQPVKYMGLKEKEVDNGEKHIGQLIKKISDIIIGAYQL